MTISSTFPLEVSSVEKTFFPKKYQAEEQGTGIHVSWFLLAALHKQRNPWINIQFQSHITALGKVALPKFAWQQSKAITFVKVNSTFK